MNKVENLPRRYKLSCVVGKWQLERSRQVQLSWQDFASWIWSLNRIAQAVWFQTYCHHTALDTCYAIVSVELYENVWRWLVLGWLRHLNDWWKLVRKGLDLPWRSRLVCVATNCRTWQFSVYHPSCLFIIIFCFPILNEASSSSSSLSCGWFFFGLLANEWTILRRLYALVLRSLRLECNLIAHWQSI